MRQNRLYKKRRILINYYPRMSGREYSPGMQNTIMRKVTKDFLGCIESLNRICWEFEDIYMRDIVKRYRERIEREPPKP